MLVLTQVRSNRNTVPSVFYKRYAQTVKEEEESGKPREEGLHLSLPLLRTLLCYSVLRTLHKFVLVIFKMDFNAVTGADFNSDSLWMMPVAISFGFQHRTQKNENQVSITLKELLLRLKFPEANLEKALFGPGRVKMNMRKLLSAHFEKQLGKVN